MNITGFYWVLQSFIGFYPVKVRFTWFLPNFTGFFGGGQESRVMLGVDMDDDDDCIGLMDPQPAIYGHHGASSRNPRLQPVNEKNRFVPFFCSSVFRCWTLNPGRQRRRILQDAISRCFFFSSFGFRWFGARFAIGCWPFTLLCVAASKTLL